MVPSVPPASVPLVQEKLLTVSASVMLFPPVPAADAVTVTVPAVRAALTPTVLPLLLIAVTMFAASVDAVDDVAK